MSNEFLAADALNTIRTELISSLGLVPLDRTNREHGQTFAVGSPNGKQFMLLIGTSKRPAKQIRIITKKISNPPNLAGVTFSDEISGSNKANQQKTSLRYDNNIRAPNQSSFYVSDETALRELLTWYATGKVPASRNEEHTTTPSKFDIETGIASDSENLDRFDGSYDEDSDIQDEALFDTDGNNEMENDRGPTTREQTIEARSVQQEFRKNVIQTWGLDEACCVTGISVKSLLIASHIIPWCESDDDQRRSGCNGILLCAHLDKLFDQHLISFDQEGQIVFSSRLSEHEWNTLTPMGITNSMKLNTSKLSPSSIVLIAKNLASHLQRLNELDRGL